MIHFEEMSLNAWPSLRTVVYKGCLFRASNGYTNRANSGNPLYSKSEDIECLAQYGENFYARQNLPCAFKMLSLPRYKEMDEYLAGKGYGMITETDVMKASLDNFAEPEKGAAVIARHFYGEWIDSFFGCNEIGGMNRETARAMLKSISVNVIVASVVEAGDIVACGYGAVENDHVGFFDIVVEKGHRRKGYGRTIMNGIIGEAKRQGVKTGYLQVVQTNEAALNLYRSLGFDRTYSYWYRKK